MESLEGKQRGDFPQSAHGYAACGFLWERVLEHFIEYDPTEVWDWIFTGVLNEVEFPNVVRPGQFKVDGIYLTPDGYNTVDHVLEEFKYTTKSVNNPITGPKFRRWISWQIPAYLNALQLTVCRLRVLFARGDWGGNPAPVWMEYLLEYQEHEIRETWEAIVNNANYMIENNLVNMEAT